MTITKKDQILQLLKNMEIVRPRDVEAIGISVLTSTGYATMAFWNALAGDFTRSLIPNQASFGRSRRRANARPMPRSAC